MKKKKIEKYVINNTIIYTSCEKDIKQYYLKTSCQKALDDKLNKEIKQKFIEGSINGLINRKLYDLALMATSEKKSFTINNKNEVYQIYALSNKKRDINLTYIDFDECARVLRKKHNLKEKDDMIIFKVEYRSNDYKIPIIEYALFNSVGAVRLHLDYCKKIKMKYYIPMKINNFEDYKYNPENRYYHDQCFSSNVDDKDLILYDRREEFNKNNMSLCESICIFKGYMNNQIICECDIKSKINSFFSDNSDKYNLIYRFKNEKPKFSFNIWVLKCYEFIFTKENLFYNKCGFIILGVLFINILGGLIFKFTEYHNLLRKIYMTMEISKEKIVNTLNEQNQNIKLNADTKNLNKDTIYSIKKNSGAKNTNKRLNLRNLFQQKKILSSNHSSKLMMNNLSNINKDKNIDTNPIIEKIIQNKKLSSERKIVKDYIIKTDNELNSLSYDEALLYDKRNFCEYYISLIRCHQLLFFTFSTKNDYNSRIIKISFLFFMIATVLIINLLLVDDWTLHELYISKGMLNLFFNNIPRIMYATIVSYFIKIILAWAISTEDIFLSIKKVGHIQTQKFLGKFGMIFVIYFGSVIFLLLFYWFYIMCFFAVFPKSQIFVLEISGISFVLLLIIPIIIDIFPPLFRLYSLNSKNREYPYKFSQFLQLI